ncbi:hypothetical protein H2202_009899 [Exophiala xenobiotica]|nr:hypothetical protein H2202_009899 [Exophiala xenobiotica]
MLESPAKRRRVIGPEPQTDVPTGNDGQQPTTPTRASYLSPTKSSLARSHPHLITRSNRGPSKDNRGKSLRDEILNKKPNATEVPETVSSYSANHSEDNRPALDHVEESLPQNESAGLQNEPADAISARHSRNTRSPLSERQSSQVNGSRRRHFSQDPLPPPIMPTLVRRTDSNAQAATRPGSNEPELPPTPVQLGLDPAPERPRGLASSSSPRGSQAGSGRHRRRTRTGGAVTSSPLKSKIRAPATNGNEAQTTTDNDVGEAPESEPEAPENEVTEDTPAGLQDEHSALRSLREELNRLKEENAQLENAIKSEEALTDGVLTILRHFSSQNGVPSSPTDSSSSLAHLTLFSPGNLQLKSRTETSNEQGRIKLVHVLTTSAPAPWLPTVFACGFRVVVDAELGQVEHAEMKDVMHDNRPYKTPRRGIYKWASERLQDRQDSLRIQHFDVAGVIWGMGKWFAATVERARIFRWLDVRYNESFSVTNKAEFIKYNEALTQGQAIELAPFLEATQIEMVAQEAPNSKKRHPACKAKVMLIWNIDLDWTGEVVSDVSLAFNGVSTKAETGLKVVFSSLYQTKGIVAAFDNVWDMIHAEDEGSERELADGQKQTGKKRKRASK